MSRIVLAAVVAAALPPPASAGPGPGRLALPEARKLVRRYVLALKPEADPGATFPLKEITPEAAWRRLGAQVFRVTGGAWESQTLLIRARQVTVLGIGSGGHGVTSMCVTDLDGDGTGELLCACSFGWGVRRTCVGVVRPDRRPLRFEDLRFVFRDGDCVLEPVSDRRVRVMQAEPGPDGKALKPVRHLATVRHVAAAGGPVVEIAPALDTAIAERILLPAARGWKIDRARSGTYTFGRWKYVYTVDSGFGIRSASGQLLYAGRHLPSPRNISDYYDTPWGPMGYVPSARIMRGPWGWLPGPPAVGGKALTPPRAATRPAEEIPDPRARHEGREQ